MKRKQLLLLVLGIFCYLNVYPQSVPLQGKVTDSDNLPVPGATVKIKNSSNGVATSVDGTFQLTYEGKAVLVVTAVGMTTSEVNLNGQKTVSVKLSYSSQGLNEVVVVGYGTQRRGEVTSAIATVKSESFTKGAVRDAAQLVQGKVAGLRITTPSSDPTGSTQINLRGLNSLNGTSEPLILIDGIPGTLNTVAPEDIEAIDVLKDGSAASIYGTRATGGVILITTRQNRSESRNSIEYSAYANVQSIVKKPEMLTADDYRRLIAEGVNYTDLGGNTNWLDEILQKPFSQNHNLTFFGGNSTTNYTGSINYRNWEGIFLKTGQERLTVRAGLNHSMFNDKLKTNLQIITRTTSSKQGGADGYAYRQAIIRNPTDNIYTADGRWQERDAYNYDNPLGRINEANNDNTFRETRMNGSLDYRPIKDLSLKMLVSRVQNNNLNGYSTTFQHVNTTKNNLNGTAGRSTYSNKENLLELTANYTKSINHHNFTLLGGYSWQDAVYEAFDVYNFDFPTDAYSWNQIEAGTALQRGLSTMNSEKSKWQLAGFFGRLTYNWNEKYLFMASIRREGSSKFGVDDQWGTFPGASVGWRISKESFMKNVPAITDLKLRGGYGETGTIASNPYASQSSYAFDFAEGAYIGGKWVQGFVPTRNFNPYLRWEKKKEYNAGLDFGLLKNRITGSFDIYSRKVEDLLYNFRVPVPPFIYETMYINAGTMKNSGFEALINVRPVETKTITWNTSITYSTNKNMLENLSNDQFNVTAEFFDAGYTGEPIQQSTHRVKAGGAIGQFFVLKSVGVDENGKWLVESKDGSTIPIAESSADDRQYYGNGIPKHLAGWNNRFKIKSFDLEINVRGAFGHDVLNMQRMYYENPANEDYNALKTAYDPVYGRQLNNDLVYVSHYIEKADYMKIDNITLGYTLPAKLKGVKNARIYVSGLNLFTITNYKGLDPEAVSYNNEFTFAPGIENRDAYPTTRTFTAGINITF
ncbi:SusC/RagA family TonB-linked outer membrane protein [Arcticibacter tournemirensis]